MSRSRAEAPPGPPVAYQWAAMAGVLLVYFASARLGLAFARIHPSISAIWPPSGIALALLILTGPRFWPAIALGAFFANIPTSGSVLVSVGIATGNTLEAAVGAWLVRRFAAGREAFARGRDVFRFAVLAGVFSTAISATLGVASLIAGGLAHSEDFRRLWFEWWFGDLGGDLIVAPALLLCAVGRRPAWSWRRWLEALLLFASLCGFARAVLMDDVPSLPLDRVPAVMCLPILIWAATRFGPRETALATLLFTSIAAWGTARGIGPFVRTDPSLGFMLLTLFACVINLTTLVMAATIAYQRRIENAFGDAFGAMGVRFQRQSADLTRAVGALRTAVRARMKAERYADAIVQALPGPLLVLDADLRIRAANPAFHRFFHIPRVATRNRRIFELAGGAWDIPKLRTLLAGPVPAEGPIEGVEIEHEFPGLGRRVLLLNVLRVTHGRSVSQLIVLAFQDVTERLRAEQELRASEERFRVVAETAGDAIITLGAGDRIVFFNHAAERLFGRAASDMIGSPVTGIVPTLASARRCEGPLDSAAADESWHDDSALETEGVRRDGTTVPLEVSVTTWSAREHLFVTLIARDVSVRKAADARIQHSEMQLERAQALAHVGSWTWDASRRRVTGSKELFRIYGLDPLTGTQPEPAFFERVHALDRGRFESAARRVLRNGGPCELDYRILRPDGSVRWIHGLAQVEPGTARMPMVSGTAQDITYRKLSEQKIRRLNSELERRVRERTEQFERSNLELQQFAYVAAHDLQEPLRTVAAYTQLLARRYRGKLDADADEIIGFATGGAEWMHHLIEDLLLYSRVGATQIALEEASVDALVERALVNLQSAIVETGAVVSRGKLPRVRADGSQLTLLFQNLIANAIKFRGSSRPQVQIGAKREGEVWTFSVRDNGMGMAPRSMQRIFEIFQRLHTREEFPGTGIGLAVCKKIVERHGGRIWAESQPGRGSTFWFTLPAIATSGEPSRRRAPPAHATAHR